MGKDASGLANGASASLLRDGYALLRADAGTARALHEVFDSAEEFFALDTGEKKRYELPDLLEGYRVYGAEHSGPLDRPDLNETFSLVLRNMARREVAPWAASNRLHRALRAAAPLYAGLVDAVLDGIRLSLNPQGDRIASADFSYFQLNYYRPARERRVFLQDAHQDGHLLTVVTSRQPGLEAEFGGRFEAVNFAKDEVLVMPGSILTLMTGGRVKPLRHRVRNVKGVATRASLMYFGNASVTRPPRAWLAAADGSLPDIGRANVEASKLFGLPSIEALAR